MATALPVDPVKAGNVWCEACQQSLAASRAQAHLASKKHLDNAGGAAEPKPGRAASAAKEKGARAPAPAREKAPSRARRADANDADDEEELGAPAPRKVAKRKAVEELDDTSVPAPRAIALPRDPSRAGNYWCGICEVSLTVAKAAGHCATARHQANEKRTLASAMRNLKVDQ